MVCLKRKPAQIVVKSSLNGLVIGPELVIIPEKHCFLWTATRDFNQRKFNYPTSYCYGLSLKTNCNLLHIFLLILLSGDVATNPGPHLFVKKKKNSVSKNKIKCSVLNARSLKSFHREEISNRIVCNLERFQNFVYNENSDIVCVNETWLTKDISNDEILHPGFTIYRKDRTNRRGGGVLIAIRMESFQSVKEYSLHMDELEQLKIVATEVKTATDQKLLFCCCYRPPNADISWMDQFKTFLNCACDHCTNIVICGDFNFPNIQWEAMENVNGANKLLFVETLNDHFLSQLNNTPTRGNNILDLVITNAPDHISLQDILSPGESAILTDHHSISFDFTAFLKAPRKVVRNVYDYAKGDFDGLCGALRAEGLTSTLSDSGEDIDTDWERWKKIFLTAVSNFIPQKKLKGRNPLPWIDGNILHRIKKKESIRRKIKKDPSGSLQRKYKFVRSEVKKLLRESREKFFQSVDNSFKVNPKRFWSVLTHKNKSCSIPNQISVPARLFDGPCSLHSDPSDEKFRTTATNPAQIASFFNKYFASVFTSENLPHEQSDEVNDPIFSDVVL